MASEASTQTGLIYADLKFSVGLELANIWIVDCYLLYIEVPVIRVNVTINYMRRSSLHVRLKLEYKYFTHVFNDALIAQCKMKSSSL